MKYPQIPDFGPLTSKLAEYARLNAEYGAQGMEDILNDTEAYLNSAIEKIVSLPRDKGIVKNEPDDYDDILKLLKKNEVRLWDGFKPEIYREKLQGAILGRFAGCTLGAPVEFYSIEEMKNWSEYIKNDFPPCDYWSEVRNPDRIRYLRSRCIEYTRNSMDGVPADDDIAYTILGLLIAMEYTTDFTTADVGKAWMKYLPMAYTAEKVTLDNLKKGIGAYEAGEINNPYIQWIGASIRADPWGYMAPGRPREAARMAYKDAYLSHRGNGIYAEMFFAAVISAAFCSKSSEEALLAGLDEIPPDSLMSDAVKWAINESSYIGNYLDARNAVEDKFKGMSGVHAVNNACLVIFGLMLGKEDFSKVIGETVAMGLDNDCNAATAGSIAGAVLGKKGIPGKWYSSFNNKVKNYFYGLNEVRLDFLYDEFEKIAGKIWK